MLLDDRPVHMEGDKVEARRMLLVEVYLLLIGPIVELAESASDADVSDAVPVYMGPSMYVSEENAPDAISCLQQRFM